jgi:hypothetical protein
MTPSRSEPATYRLVVQCLNQLRYLVPPNKIFNVRKFYVYFTPYIPVFCGSQESRYLSLFTDLILGVIAKFSKSS